MSSYFTASAWQPAVAMKPNGDFVVVWMSYPQDGSSWGVFGRRFSASGVSQGSEFRVNTYTPGFQDSPAIAIGDSGEFVVVWESLHQDGSYAGIFGQRFDAAANFVGSEFQVNTFTPDIQRNPKVDRASDGRFAVVWTSENVDASSEGIAARRFDASGNPIGAEFLVNAYTTGPQVFGDIDVAANGDFVAVYEDRFNNRDGISTPSSDSASQPPEAGSVPSSSSIPTRRGGSPYLR